MLKKSILLLGLLLLGMSSASAIEDFGVINSVLPGLVSSDHDIVPGQTYRGDTFDFPTYADTWTMTYYPHWWNAGDTVYGTYVTTETIDHAEISFTMTRNSLVDGGHCDIEFRIDGTTVGSFTVTESSGFGPVTEAFDFTPIPAGSHELRYYETNTVASGCGSFDMNEASGINSVAFSYLTSLTQTTWGAIKTAI